jgi:hypothetical protein
LCRICGESGGRKISSGRRRTHGRGGRKVRGKPGAFKEEFIGLVALEEVILGPNIVILCPGQVYLISHEKEKVKGGPRNREKRIRSGGGRRGRAWASEGVALRSSSGTEKLVC